MNEIELLIEEWSNLTEAIWKQEYIDIDKFKILARRTNDLMQEYRNKECVPKRICSLLMEMQWFSWWIADGEHSPMHGLYQEFGEIVSALTGHFFDYDKGYYDIEPFLDEL